MPSVRDSVAPSGMPETSTLSVSEPSVSVREDATLSGIGVSSVPVASLSVSVGASAILSETSTLIVPDAVAVDVTLLSGSVSVLVAVTVSEKSVLSSVAGVMVRPVSSDGVSVATPFVTETAVPFSSVNVAPVGIPAISTDSVSDPSVSFRDEVISRAIAVFSDPLTSAVPSSSLSVPTSKFGPSATAFTVTLIVAVLVAVWPAPVPIVSVDVAETVRLKSSALSSGGTIFKPLRDEAASVTLLGSVSSAKLATVLPCASCNTDPAGIFPIVTADSVSVPPSVFASAAEIFRSIAVSSDPLAGPPETLGPCAEVTTSSGPSFCVVVVVVVVVSSFPSAPCSSCCSGSGS